MNTPIDASRYPALKWLDQALSAPGSAAVLRSAGQVLAVTALAQLLALGLQLLAARLLGPVEFGIYGFVLAGLGLCLIPGKFGLDTTLIRLVAQFTAASETPRLRGLLRFARAAGLGLGLLVAGAALLWTSVAGTLDAPGLRRAALVGAVLLPFAVLSELTAAALRGLRRVASALTGDGLVRPVVAAGSLLMLAAFRPAWLTGAAAMGAYLLGTILSLVLTTVLLRRSVPPGLVVVTREHIRGYLRIAFSLMIASGILVAMYSLDTVMIGVIADTTTAGFYSVASRVAIVVLFVMNGAQMVVAPLLASIAGTGAGPELRRVVRVLNGLSVAAGVPAALVLALAAGLVMELFGPEFREGATALRILAISQLLNVLTGPTGLVLSMTGLERRLVQLLAGGLALNVVLNVLWIPIFGLVGAAMASLVAQASWNIGAVVVIRLQLGLDVTPFDLVRRASPQAG